MPAPALPPANDVIPQPDQPDDPPSADDVTHALRYSRNISAAHISGHATNDHLADAAVYQLSVVQARAGAGGDAPAWFMPAIVLAIQPLTDSINLLTNEVNRLVNTVNQLARTSALAYNRQVGDGVHIPFEVVRFPDGSNPTSNPHDLPALIGVESVRALSGAHSRRYFSNYYPDDEIPGRMEDRRPFILRAIGAG